ncbi:hypothetical protein [Natrinema salaciae]|uniref:Uncharacterized protein n=1 Tax=Natrinema salaciae TaxID=1186196 RepID=A0A1H9M645_9EURY|nr:hypothetical protein [Natrinema salaciae]SER19154.1 hypothetical protein SAMN04489841_3219 [Natrinema salaciae]
MIDETIPEPSSQANILETVRNGTNSTTPVEPTIPIRSTDLETTGSSVDRVRFRLEQ